MPELAQQIRVERDGDSAKLFIDGEEFPWVIASPEVVVSVSRDEVPSVTITLWATKIEVVNSLNGLSSAPDA